MHATAQKMNTKTIRNALTQSLHFVITDECTQPPALPRRPTDQPGTGSADCAFPHVALFLVPRLSPLASALPLVDRRSRIQSYFSRRLRNRLRGLRKQLSCSQAESYLRLG